MQNGTNYRTNFTLFSSKWEKGVRLEVTAAATSAGRAQEYINTGENSAKGFEYEVEYSMETSGLSFFSTGSYVTSKDEAAGVDYTGFPEVMINWGGHYDWVEKKIRFSVYNHHEFDRTATPIDGSDKLDSYFRTDFFAKWMPTDDFDLYLSVRNAFDITNDNPHVWQKAEGHREPGFDASVGMHYRF